MIKNKYTGFTLIEISIVLVIIGLLAGGILKGQKMIENAKYKSWVKEIDALRTAVYAFQDRYKTLPGDMRNAATVLPTVGGVSAINGNGDGIIQNAYGAESVRVIHHLVLAGLIKGDASCQNIVNCKMSTAVGGMNGNIGSGAWANGKWGLKAMYHNTPVQYAQRYDEEFDDGKANSGSVSCYPYGGDANGVLASACTGSANWPNSGQTVAMFVDF